MGAALAAVVALAGGLVVGGCGGGTNDGGKVLPTVAVSPSSSVSVSTAAPAVPDTAVGASATTTAPSSGRGSPSAAGGGAGSSPGGGGGGTPGAAALAPAAAGTYRYDTSGSSVFGLTTVPFPAVTTLTVDPPSGTRQHSTRDLRDALGNGPVLELSLDYRFDGIALEGLKVTTAASGVTNVQDLRPASPALLLATGAGPGARQEVDLSGTGSTAHLVLDVLRQERVTVGGQGVDTLVLHLLATLGPGEITGTLDMTAWFAPSVRLWVKESFVSDAAAGGGLFRFHGAYDATLQRLP